MDFDFSDEQRQLRDAVAAFLAKEYPFERARANRRAARDWDPEVWAGLAGLGVTALNVPAECGGLGFGALETLALMDACGPYLLQEPLLGSAVIATALLGSYAQAAPAAALLRAMAAGEQVAVVAHFEPYARFDVCQVHTRATPEGAGFRLTGHKAVVMHAGSADTLLVSAREPAGPGGAGGAPGGAGGGMSLFLVPRATPGVRLERYFTVDGQSGADVHLESVQLPADHRLGGAGAALPAIEAAFDLGMAALCAEAVGIMQALLDATVEYLKARQQFGQPIGRFQALQHRIADMVTHLEQARSMSYLAAMRGNHPEPDTRRRALSAAKVIVSEASRFIGQQAVQLHGGMGMTDELPVSHWFKRLTAIDVMFGDADIHLQRYAALSRTIHEGTVHV
jgi:alkylation response protein AidB-like acyl-CoA dehydrogenase